MVPSISQRNSTTNPTRNLKRVIRRPPTPRYCRGTKVEVSSGQEGYVGSYYEGTVVAELTNDAYIIQYKTLVTDDLSRPLREVVPAAEVRPRPPVVTAADEYRLHDVVDAYDNEGWWVGRVTGWSGDGYSVYFDSTGDEIVYAEDRLRVHQDWVRGKWVPMFFH